jgi:hypothetical protein
LPVGRNPVVFRNRQGEGEPRWQGLSNLTLVPSIPPGASAYMLKPEARGSQPPHWVCTQCYQNRKPSIMQLFGSLGDLYVYKCPECSNRFTNDGDPPRWID